MAENRRIKVLIIEDEEPARALIKHYLLKHNEIDLLGECADGFCGLKAIKELKPDLIFLDIQMPKLSGFEMLEVLDEKPEIIFTTAFDEYAIRAFDIHAVDYLLKPFPEERFDNAISKAIARISEGSDIRDYTTALKDKSPVGSPSLSRIVVRKGSGISLIPISNIYYLEAEDDYVMIWHKEGKALKQQTMKYYEKNLPENDFVRIHRSYIVSIEQVARIEPYGKDTYKAILKNESRLPVSRSGYKNLMGKA